MKPCPHWTLGYPLCGGCLNRTLPYFELAQKVKNTFLNQFQNNFNYLPSNIKVLSPPKSEVRERVDFQIQEGKVGLLSPDLVTGIIDIEFCDIIEPRLFNHFLKIKPLLKDLVKKGSFRLRLDRELNPFLWLDVSHKDTQVLFQEKASLLSLLSHTRIEWGQKKKPLLIDSQGDLKLQKSYVADQLPYLFKTQVEGQTFDLQMHVSDFSQPNQELNFGILGYLIEQLKNLNPSCIAEFGSGSGNLSFAMASYTQFLMGFEWDAFACKAWTVNHQRFTEAFPNIKTQMKLNLMDARRLFDDESLTPPDILVVNPSRSGLGDFFKSIELKSVKAIFYLSCYPESLLKDMLPLKSQFTCNKILFIDQFPYSGHIETLSVWVKT